MICPICQVNHNQKPGLEHCTQCGSDLRIHHLLKELKPQPKEPTVKHDSQPLHEIPLSTRRSSWFMVWVQLAPSAILTACALFGIFVGFRFLSFLEQERGLHQVSLSNKWSETGYEQLQQMNTTIKQELDLIIDQRREISELRAQVKEITNTTQSTGVQPTKNIKIQPPQTSPSSNTLSGGKL